MHAKSRGMRARGSGGKRRDRVGDVLLRHLSRLRIVVGKRDRRRRQHVRPSALGLTHRAVAAPRPIGARLAAGVRQLHAGDAALRVHEAGDAREHVDVIVLPDAEIFRTDPAFGRDGRRLGEHQAGAADGAAAEMDEMPVVGEAVRARVLAHRRHEHAVGERDAADRQRLEQVRHARNVNLWDRSVELGGLK